MILSGFSFQNETLILDDFLYPYNVIAVRYILFRTREAWKKIEEDINTSFNRLNYIECKRGMKFISFRNETHFRIL